MDYKVTVIMSNYNQACFLTQAIESVLTQKTNFKYRLIITDDCSLKDNSVEIIKNYSNKYPEIIIPLLNTENGRYLKNILRAKALTKTPYFCLLDSDDYWTDKNYLQEAFDFLEAHPDFTIYSRNVTCLKEDGTTYPLISEKQEEGNFSIENYLNNNIVISQTTGSFFRNVIFSKEIPSIMTEAIGTIAERSFEGDVDRFIMHLKYGKAHYSPKPSGVYRILSTGIWCRLNDFEKHIIQAQAFIDYNRYYEEKYNSFFLKSAIQEFNRGIKALDNLNCATSSKEIESMFFNILNIYLKNKSTIKLLDKEIKKKFKLKYKILYAFYKYCKRKLNKKGINLLFTV